MKKMINLLILMSSISLLAGCNKKKESNFTDLLGREVKVNLNKVDRVICLGAGALRMYSYIGDIDKLVGVEKIDKEPFGVGTALRPYYHVNKEKFKELPLCGEGGPKAQAPEMEKIASCEPNIIISLYSSKDVNDNLQNTLGVPVIALSQGKEALFSEEVKKSFTLLGKIFNKEKRAEELNSYIETSKKELDKLEKTTETYYAGCIGNWGSTNLYGSYKNFPIFEGAKVNNVIDSLSDLVSYKQVQIDKEKLLELNPDKIFVDGAGFASFLSDYKEHKSDYTALKAIENKEVYALLPYNAYYTNLEIQLISTYYVASVAHPTSFVEFDIAKKADEITTKFLGKAIYNEMKEYSTAIGGYQKLDLDSLIA